MTKASRRLHVSQSALSHQLTELETGLGVRLFQRLPRSMVLTGAGERLLRSSRVVLAELREAELDLRSSPMSEEGLLRITTECYTCYHWLPARLRAFEAQYPRVEVRIVAEATRRPMEALLAGDVDIGIIAGGVSSRRVMARPLFRDELVVVMSPEHELAKRAFIVPEDFATQHLLTYSVPPEQLSIWTEVLRPAGVKPARISRVELTEAMVEMVKANLGIAVLARWAAAPWLNPGLLQAVRLTKRGKFRDWTAVTRKLQRQPRYFEAFVDLLADTALPR